jgi:hypothetical protein
LIEMTKNSTKKPSREEEPLPPLLFPAKDRKAESWVRRLKSSGRIRRIGPRLYTSVPEKEEAGAVQAGWRDILTELFPHALLSHRSALEFRPSPEQTLVLTATTNREIQFPGLRLQFVRGPGPLRDDPVVAGIHASSVPRALLENLSTSKSSAARSVGIAALEERLERELSTSDGEARLNGIRDRARQIAEELGWEREFRKLDQIIGALLGTRLASALAAPSARARAFGQPYDGGRVRLFDLLYSALQNHPLERRLEPKLGPAHFRNKAFFESYFSNYIEGTTFEVEEAEEIVFDGKIPPKRPKDGHDILGTFALVSDPNEMRKVPKDAEEFLRSLRERHRRFLGARPEVNPGVFKEKANRAGDTHFVDPGLVEGTLRQGFARYRELPPGLPRAIFMMFLVAEVHPFTDGNGRIARVQMNAELFSQGLGTIIVPTVYRDDYLKALRGITRRDRADLLIRMLDRAQEFSLLDFSDYPKVLRYLREHNWFREPDEAAIVR